MRQTPPLTTHDGKTPGRGADWPRQCAAVIPCLNEASTIGPLVTEVRQFLTRVIVVDDGSADETASTARAAGAEVIRHERRQGKGAALETGWQRAREAGLTWALCLDGDGQHAPADIPRFLTRAEASSARLLVGNRMPEAARIPWLRRHVNRWMSRRLSRLAGHDLPDSQCGFRLMHLPSWAGLQLQATHFVTESELLLEFVAAGLAVEFVPIHVIYRAERSKIDPVRDTWRWFRWLWAQRK